MKKAPTTKAVRRPPRGYSTTTDPVDPIAPISDAMADADIVPDRSIPPPGALDSRGTQ